MSIGKLENTKDNYVNRNPIYNGTDEIALFMIQTVDILVAQAFEIQELRKELAKKEDKIDVNNIKEVKRING